MANKIYHLVQIDCNKPSDSLPVCKESNCAYSGECANHVSAGDTREEAGMTPKLKYEKSLWYCTKKPQGNGGMILKNGNYYCRN